MDNGNKIILDLCGGTGAWSKPYVDNGYDVRNITLPAYDVRLYKPPKNVYGILAAPPCTHFSIARSQGKTPRDFRKSMELVIACLNIIWECRYEPLYRKDGCLKFWCIENPSGFLRQFLGKPALTFHPYEYGNPYTKSTDLWGYFNIPKKKIIDMNNDEIARNKINARKLPTISEFTGSKQSARRAITPSGFAQAFYKVNK